MARRMSGLRRLCVDLAAAVDGRLEMSAVLDYLVGNSAGDLDAAVEAVRAAAAVAPPAERQVLAIIAGYLEGRRR